MGRPAENSDNVRLLFRNNLLILILLMLPTVCVVPQVRCMAAANHVRRSPCCSFPCKNGGSCIETCEGYKCDCSGTNHYGKTCKIERLSHKLKKFIWAGAMKLGLSNFVTDIRLVQYDPKFSRDHGGFCNKNFNFLEPMLLSPVPENCPTPLGVAGFQILPPIDTLFDLVLKRRRSVQQTTSTTNLLFVVFAQFLALQMWKCTNPNWIGSQAMYGTFVRTGSCGKVSKQYSDQQKNFYHNVFTDALQSIIIHEHNRVCDILSQEHTNWNDHRLFETATLIVTGEILTIASAEWLPLLYDFGGHINVKSPYPYVVSNKVPKEIQLAFLWPQMFPDPLYIEGSNVDLGVMMNGGDKGLPQGGHYQLMKFMATSAPGKMGPQNVPAGLEAATKQLIVEGRKFKFQSFNNYREYLGLGRLSSFAKLTNNNEVRKHLQKMYGDINGLELITGLLLETPKKERFLGETTTALISNMVFKAVVTHPLNSVPFKKKLTFGSKTGWNIVKNAKIHSLICNNVDDKRLCERERLISFKRKIRNQPITCSAKSVNAEKPKKSSCYKNTAKTTGPVVKCRPLTPVKPGCTKVGGITPNPLPVRVTPSKEKLKDIETTQKTPCVPASHCSAKTTTVGQTQPNACVDKTEVKIVCSQKEKGCFIRPWFRTCPKKPTQNTTSEVQKASFVPKTTSEQIQTCAPKTDEIYSNSEPKLGSASETTTLEKTSAYILKKCRSWFRTSSKKRPQNMEPGPPMFSCAQKPTYSPKPTCQKVKAEKTNLQTKPKPACAQKNIDTYTKKAPTSESPCKTQTTLCGKPEKKCCVKRSWFRAWKG